MEYHSEEYGMGLVKAQPNDLGDDEDILDISDEDLGEDEPVKKRRGRKPKSAMADSDGETVSKKKVKISFDESEMPAGLSALVSKIREMGVKDVNVSEIILLALNLLTEEQWKELEAQYTPIELRIKAALNNPNTKDKLLELLSLS